MNSATYRPELDSLRAIAITVVMLHHYMHRWLPFSGYGVVLFFVLSGYFGTRVLLGLKSSLESRRMTLGASLRLFYARRYLRILPPHLVILIVTALFAVPYAREKFFWNAMFLANIGMLIEGDWFGRFSPLWSLSLLEQFYLVWPALILLTPRRWLTAVIVGIIGSAIMFRFVALGLSFGSFGWTMPPLTGLDQLGSGALLALWRSAPAHADVLKQLRRIGGFICVPAMIGILIWRSISGPPPYLAMYAPLVASLCFAWIIDRLLDGVDGATGAFLRMPWLAAAGRVSYAAFLLHSFTELLVPRIGVMDELMATDLRALILVPLTFLLAQVSWKVLEEPIAQFRKSRFSTARSPTPAATVAGN